MNPNYKTEKIEIRLHTRVNLLNRDWGRKFLRSLTALGGGCFEPDEYNYPQMKKFSFKNDGLDGALVMWDGGLKLKRLRPPKCEFLFDGNYVAENGRLVNPDNPTPIYSLRFLVTRPSEGALDELLEYLIRDATPLWFGVASEIHFYDKTTAFYIQPPGFCGFIASLDEVWTSVTPFLEGIFARIFIGDELIQRFHWEEKLRKPPFPAERRSCGVLITAYDDILASDWEKEDAIAAYLGWEHIADVREYYRKHHVIPVTSPQDRNIFAHDRSIIPEEYLTFLEAFLPEAEEHPRVLEWISNLADGSFYAKLLAKNPDLADKCPWEKLNGADWASLLEKQPQFADRCPWEKLDSADWAGLLEKQPQFAERRNSTA